MMSIRNKRRTIGAVMTEFSAAMVVFICLFLIPLIDIGVIPIRYFMAQGVLNDTAVKLALCEKRSAAYDILLEDIQWRALLEKVGVHVKGAKLNLLIVSQNTTSQSVVKRNQQVQPEWLPQGTKAPCVYTLEMAAQCDIAPLVSTRAGIPGLTGPMRFVITSRAQWENMGRDPKSGEYYINE